LNFFPFISDKLSYPSVENREDGSDLKTLQEIVEVFQDFTVRGEYMINLALDGLCFREEL